jgi:prepilin-type N-terminal cleavage/methylation domain-containing protein
MKRGFTVVEVLITLTIMAILFGLGTVGLRSSLANARDAERLSDIQTIARGLEQRYDTTYSYNWTEDTNSDGIPDTPRTTTWNAGSYPGNNELWDTFFWTGHARVGEVLPGVTDAARTSPSGLGMGGVCIFWFWNADCDTAEKDSVIQGSFSDGNGGWKDIYVYEFIGANGNYCNVDDCTRYNLYWISETDKTVFKGIPGLKVWKSKHQ